MSILFVILFETLRYKKWFMLFYNSIIICILYFEIIGCVQQLHIKIAINDISLRIFECQITKKFLFNGYCNDVNAASNYLLKV